MGFTRTQIPDRLVRDGNVQVVRRDADIGVFSSVVDIR